MATTDKDKKTYSWSTPNFFEELTTFNEQRKQEQAKRVAALKKKVSEEGNRELAKTTRNYTTTSNATTSVARGRQQNKHLEERGLRGAAQHAAWEKEHPNLATWSQTAAAIPFAVAAYPFIAGGTAAADAAAATTAGQTVTSGLNFAANAIKANPNVAKALPWLNAALTSMFAGHGASEVAQGRFTPMTALELAPLGQTIRPAWNFTRSFMSRTPVQKIESQVVRSISPDGKIRLSLSSHTQDRPRQLVLEPQGNNKYYIHTRTWDGDHIPANMSASEKQALYDALYEELPEGAEILFPQSSSEYLATRGTVAGLQRLARDSRFTPGTRGTLQYLDKDGKTVRTYEGTSFIKTPRITPENAASITPEQWTAAQDAAIARGDVAEAQRLRDLHFKAKSQTKILDENGNVLPNFHYSDSKFTAFNPNKIGVNDPGFYGRGFYFTPNRNYASTYGENEYKVYINSKNPFKTNNSEDRSLAAFSFNRTDGSPLIDIDKLNLRKELEGADAVWQKGVAPVRGDKPIEEIVVPNPNQIKLSDAVTFDDNGVRIPLGKRDSNIDDIRYFKDGYGNEVVLTPYSGSDEELLSNLKKATKVIVDHYVNNPQKIQQVKQTMGWGDIEYNELLAELSRILRYGEGEVKGVNDGFKAFAQSAIKGFQGEDVSMVYPNNIITLNRDRLPNDNRALEAAIHEIGGHAKTLHLDPTVNGGIWDLLKQMYPRVTQLMEKNKEIADATLQLNEKGRFYAQFPNSSDLEIFLEEHPEYKSMTEKLFNMRRRFKYVTGDTQERAARGYTQQLMDHLGKPSDQGLTEFYTQPSVNEFSKKVLSIAAPITFTLPFLNNDK